MIDDFRFLVLASLSRSLAAQSNVRYSKSEESRKPFESSLCADDERKNLIAVFCRSVLVAAAVQSTVIRLTFLSSIAF